MGLLRNEGERAPLHADGALASELAVLEPPYILRPTIRFAYCTGMRRWDCSTKATRPTTSTITNATTMNLVAPFSPPVSDHMAVGKAVSYTHLRAHETGRNIV